MHNSKMWEEFQLGHRSVREELHATVNDKGEIILGANLARKFGEHRWVRLYWNNWERKVGIKPTGVARENAFPVVHKSNGKHLVIRAGKFFRYYAITMPYTTAIHAEFDEHGMLLLDLNMTRKATRSNALSTLNRSALSNAPKA